MNDYQPRGRVKVLMDAMRDDPHRVWTVREIARLLKVRTNEVTAYALYAMKAQALFRGKRDGETVFAPMPFPEHEALTPKKRKVRPANRTAVNWNPGDDIRVPRVVPNWRPPVMVAPRAGSGL